MKHLFFVVVLFLSAGIQQLSAKSGTPVLDSAISTLDFSTSIELSESMDIDFIPNCKIKLIICYCGAPVRFQHCTGPGALHPPLWEFAHSLCAQACGPYPNGTGWQGAP